jgi:peroxiredoxin
MTNPLTGDYEAVLQVAIRQISGLLGTLHQNGANENAPLSLPHSETGRVGDPRRRPPDGGVVVDGGVFAEWLQAYQRSSPGRGLNDIQTALITAAPPGAATMLTDAFAALRAQTTTIELPPPNQVRGLVKLQLSPGTISVAEGSTSEVTVSTRLRARYYPDQGAADLPVPIHGTVQAAFRVRKVTSPGGPKLLILPSAEDAKIHFTAASGSGLSAADQNVLSAEVRKALRDSMTPAPATLPRDFPFTEFKGLGSGSSQALALPFQISGAPAPASGVQPLAQSFVGSSGFAVAVSAGYISRLFDIDAIRQALNATRFTINVSVWPFSASVTYQLRFTSGPTLTFKAGGIEIAGSVAAETGTWWAPNGSVSFKQTIGLALDTTSQTITPVRLGDPQVDQSWFIPHQTVLNTVRSQIDQALAVNTTSVRKIFADGKNTLRQALSSFDPFSSISFASVEIRPECVIVRGEIGGATRRPPMVIVAETERGAAFTAFDSWVPAGQIDRFIWSWVEYPHWNVFNGIEKSFTDEHRFIFPKPAAATQLSQICLRIEGTQVSPGGQETSVAAGTTCSVGEFEFAIDVPASWGPVALPVWRPNIDETDIVTNAIAAHVAVHADVAIRAPMAKNALVHFADWSTDKPLAPLNAALALVRNSAPLMTIVVLPAGAFDVTRRALEDRLSLSREHKISIQLTEDCEGGWTRLFGAARKPSTYLMNPSRALVWQQEGALDSKSFAAAMDRHMAPTSPSSFRPVRLNVALGETVPDAWLEADDREQFSLLRLRGREVLLNFWQSWSTPCLAELTRLQRLHEAGNGSPHIIALHGGKNVEALAEIRKRLGLSFVLVQDSQQRIARRYGVRCWPTTVAIGTDGRVAHIQFGTAHDHKAAGTGAIRG